MLVLSRDLMIGPGVLCDLRWVKARNAYAVSKESRTAQGVRLKDHRFKHNRSRHAPIRVLLSHDPNPAMSRRGLSHE